MKIEIDNNTGSTLVIITAIIVFSIAACVGISRMAGCSESIGAVEIPKFSQAYREQDIRNTKELIELNKSK